MELLEKLPELIAQYGTYIAGAGVIGLELFGRLKKTSKPMSAVRVAARAVRAAANALDSVAGVLDKIVPDKNK